MIEPHDNFKKNAININVEEKEILYCIIQMNLVLCTMIGW